MEESQLLAALENLRFGGQKMICLECGKWSPADAETGYDADGFCSDECEEKSLNRFDFDDSYDDDWVESIDNEPDRESVEEYRR